MIKNYCAAGNGLMECPLSISLKNSSLGHFRLLRIKNQVLWIFLHLLTTKVIVGEGIKCSTAVVLKLSLLSSLLIYIKLIQKLFQHSQVLQSDDSIFLSFNFIFDLIA